MISFALTQNKQRLCLLMILVLGVSLASASHAESKFRGIGVDSSITGGDIDLLDSWNVNIVYYNVDTNFDGVPADEAAYLAKLDQALTLFDGRLAQYSAKGIKVVINPSPPGEFVARNEPALHRVFAEQWCQTALINAWKVIATRYKGNSNVWGYNLLSEPAQASVAQGLLDWRDLSSKIVDEIRTIDTDMPLIIMPIYGNPVKMGKLKVIKDKGTVIYAFNGYSPFNFTHQGLYGIKRGFPFPSKKHSVAKVKQFYSRGFRFGKNNGVPLFVPEFTVVRWAPKGSGARYLRTVIKLLEKNNVDWTYHIFYATSSGTGGGNVKGAVPWSLLHSGNFADSSPASKDTDRLKVLKSFFKKNQ